MSLTPEQAAAALALARRVQDGAWPQGYKSLARAVLHFAEQRDEAWRDGKVYCEAFTKALNERNELRKTVQRLNRRSQQAESQLVKLQKQIERTPVVTHRQNLPLVKELIEVRKQLEWGEEST